MAKRGRAIPGPAGKFQFSAYSSIDTDGAGSKLNLSASIFVLSTMLPISQALQVMTANKVRFTRSAM